MKRRLRFRRRLANRGTPSTPLLQARPCPLPWRSGRRNIVRHVSVAMAMWLTSPSDGSLDWLLDDAPYVCPGARP